MGLNLRYRRQNQGGRENIVNHKSKKQMDISKNLKAEKRGYSKAFSF